MTLKERFHLLMRERKQFPKNSYEYQYRTNACRKFVWIMKGIPVNEWPVRS